MSVIGLLVGFAAGWGLAAIAPKDFPIWALFICSYLMGATVGVIAAGIGLP